MRRHRLLLLCLLAAVVLPASMSAAFHDEPPSPPNVRTSSVDTGWTKSTSEIVVEYDWRIAEGTVTASVVNALGDDVMTSLSHDYLPAEYGLWEYARTVRIGYDSAPVPGGSEIDGPGSCGVVSSTGPFTLTITARSEAYGGGAPSEPATETRAFDLDCNVPPSPTITSPEPMTTVACPGIPCDSAGHQTLLAPTEIMDRRRIVIEGSAGDGLSGVRQVIVSFYAAGQYQKPNEWETVTISCVGGCPRSTTFRWEGSIRPQFWTVRASAVDAAGNESVPSEFVQFLAA